MIPCKTSEVQVPLEKHPAQKSFSPKTHALSDSQQTSAQLIPLENVVPCQEYSYCFIYCLDLTLAPENRPLEKEIPIGNHNF